MNSIRQGASASFGSDVRKIMLVGTASIAALTIASTGFAQSTPSQSGSAGAAEVQAGGEPVVSGSAAPTETATSGSQPSGQEIVVTGSRIARKDYTANSPIVTADSSLLEQSSTASVEANLNKLPQFTPANLKTPTTGGGDIQPSATNTPGSAAIALRGIGTNRTLVLINGRRATPADATGTVDINTIPSAAIERVEIISGGASSTYGADAVAGVTNFIMKSRFTGVELDAQNGITQQGDGYEFQVSGIIGTNFADNRGNISIAMSLDERKAAYQRNRSWYKDLWANPNVAGTGFFPNVAGVNLGYGNDVSAAGLATAFPQGGVTSSAGTTVYVNPNGSLFTGFDSLSTGGAKYNQIVDGYNYKLLSNGVLGANDTFNYVVFPARRYNVFAQGNYELNDNVEFFAQSNFSNSQTHSIQEPGPITGGWSVSIPYNSAAPQANIPVALRNLLNARANPNAPFTITELLPFNRTSTGDVYSYNMTAGLRGHIPWNDWSYEIFGSQGRTESDVTQGGFVSLERLRTVLAYGNFGQGFKATGNAAYGGFGASSATCTSGFNPFGGTVSADCIAAVTADIQTKSTMQQTIWEGDLQGTVIHLPAGDLKAAIGASYRSNKYHFENDTLTTQGESFQDQALGLYPSGNSSGEINAREVYGELAVPVLRDLPFVKEFNLELGGRISHYNTTGTSYTYKALGDWRVNDWLRFRGGYNRAERTPNVAELYLAPQQSFAYSAGGDVCSRSSLLAYSANAKVNPNAAKVEAICRVLMARTGDPTAATTYYNSTQPTGGSFIFPTQAGNPNLKPEKADTYTAGMVITSPFQNEFLRRLRLTVDYYNIQVNDAIGVQSVDTAQRQCFDTAYNPSLSADSAYCAGIGRNAVTGSLGNVVTTYFNNGRFRTSGIDGQIDWSIHAGPGQVNITTAVNYLISMKSAELPTLPLVEYAGTLGPTNNGLNGGSYRWRAFTTLGYSIGSNSISLQWQHLPSVKLESSALTPNSTVGGYPSYNLFNLTGTVGVTRDVTFRYGIENLFNKKPPLGGVDSAPTAGNLSGGSYNAQFYDIIGRRFYIGAKAKF